jgi:hypothetical protein
MYPSEKEVRCHKPLETPRPSNVSFLFSGGFFRSTGTDLPENLSIAAVIDLLPITSNWISQKIERVGYN